MFLECCLQWRTLLASASKLKESYSRSSLQFALIFRQEKDFFRSLCHCSMVSKQWLWGVNTQCGGTQGLGTYITGKSHLRAHKDKRTTVRGQHTVMKITDICQSLSSPSPLPMALKKVLLIPTNTWEQCIPCTKCLGSQRSSFRNNGHSRRRDGHDDAHGVGSRYEIIIIRL